MCLPHGEAGSRERFTASLGYDDETVEALARLVREWGRERVPPFVQEREAAGEFPRDLYAEMGELGFFGASSTSRSAGPTWASPPSPRWPSSSPGSTHRFRRR